MLVITDLLEIADTYRSLLGIEAETTVSHRVFGDTKRLGALRDGREITVGRFHAAMGWFAANWPDSAEVPEKLRQYLPPQEAAE